MDLPDQQNNQSTQNTYNDIFKCEMNLLTKDHNIFVSKNIKRNTFVKINSHDSNPKFLVNTQNVL